MVMSFLSSYSLDLSLSLVLTLSLIHSLFPSFSRSHSLCWVSPSESRKVSTLQFVKGRRLARNSISLKTFPPLSCFHPLVNVCLLPSVCFFSLFIFQQNLSSNFVLLCFLLCTLLREKPISTKLQLKVVLFWNPAESNWTERGKLWKNF